MTGLDLDAIEASINRHKQAIGPGGDKAWAAGQLAQQAPGLVAEIRQLRAKLEDRRQRLVAAEADLLDVRGILSPNGNPRRVPMDLVPTVAPAVQWLADRVDELTAGQTHAAPAAVTERQLLVDVRRWAVANGWHLLWSGWANAIRLDDATALVDWDHEELIVRRRAKAGGPWSMGMAPGRWERYPVASVRQAVDILCALWILPPRFSSAYRAALAVAR